MRIFFKILSALIVDLVWSIGLWKVAGISLKAYWWSFLVPIVLSLFPAGEFINIFLIAAAILFFHNEGFQQVIQEYLSAR